MMSKQFGFLSLACALTVSMSQTAEPKTYKPKEGYVPDATTAIRVAEAIAIPIYGEKLIRSEEPFSATLTGGVWLVRGADLQPNESGGVAEVKISKSTGEILGVIHGK